MMTAQKIDGQSGIGKLLQDNILAFAENANTPNALVQETRIDLIATGLAANCIDKIALPSREQHIILRVKPLIRNTFGSDEELIGEFGFALGGAAGVELDRYDLALGTPPHTLLIAASIGHTDNYPLVSDEITYGEMLGSDHEKILILKGLKAAAQRFSVLK